MENFLTTMNSLLSQAARNCLQDAIGLAVEYQHDTVGLPHLLFAFIKRNPGYINPLRNESGLGIHALTAALKASLTTQRNGTTDMPVFDELVVKCLEQSWQHASVVWGMTAIPEQAFLASVLMSKEFIQELPDALAETLRCNPFQADALLKAWAFENPLPPPAAEGLTEDEQFMRKYTRNLTELARQGKLDPVPGRHKEIRQMIHILLRRRQNNPILTGEPGVGKTAVVEGLALSIAENTVPPFLQHCEIFSLDLGAMQAGASVKGEFEQRLHTLLSALQRWPQQVLLFIDEAHTLIGAGGQPGQNDAANLLKPALARGEVRVIAATTWSEYKKYVEKDAALTRRFQVVKVNEPDEMTAMSMLRSIKDRLSQHHQVQIHEDAIEAAVKLSVRFITGRQLPDKAVSLLDTACSRVAVSRCYIPCEIEMMRARQKDLQQEKDALHHEGDHEEKERILSQEESALQDAIDGLENDWKQQLVRVDEFDQAETAAEKRQLHAALNRLQKESPLVYGCVDAMCISDVVSDWTGIPLNRVVSSQQFIRAELLERLEQRILGQRAALEVIVRQMQIHRAGLADPDKPVGVFLLAGTSGTGKTETAHVLAEQLYGGRQNLIVINMSEFQEAHSVSGLKGAPPGYVGYGEGGVLTEAVRHSPYSVVLIDELEKAHPDVLEMFYQIFDKGILDDSEGVEINFRNCLFILTSNHANATLLQAWRTGNRSYTELTELIREDFEQQFQPAFMGRVVLTPFLPFSSATLASIVRLKLRHVESRLHEASGGRSRLTWSDSVVNFILQACPSDQTGARKIDAIINSELLPLLAERLLASGQSQECLQYRVKAGKLVLTTTAKDSLK